MKLSIAVGILSARSALYSAQAVIDSTSVSRGDGRRALLNLVGPTGFSKKQSSSLTGSTPSATTRSSSRALEDFKGDECDFEASADVGVLVCASDEVCVANADSSMGGFCYETDGLFNACDPSSASFDAACDCSAFDLQTNTGTISYPAGNENMGAHYYGCYDIVADVSFMASFKDNMYIWHGGCTEFVVGGDATKSTKLCSKVYTVNGNPNRYDGTSCELQIDGQVCNSCTLTEEFLGSTADCSNVVDGLIVAIGDRRLLPIIEACYNPINGTRCNLCSNNTYMDYNQYDTTAISLAGFGSDFTCGGLRTANGYYQISSDKCPEAAALAQAECCASPSPAPSSEPTSGPMSPSGSTSTPMSPSPASALSLVSAGIMLTGTSFMLVMN